MERRPSVSWGGSSTESLQQSRWLRIDLSELDKKTRAMLRLIEDDGEDDSLEKEVEMYYNKKPKLKQMVEEINRAYHNLADKYDRLSTGSSYVQTSEFSSTSSDSTEGHHIDNTVVEIDCSKWEEFHLHPGSVVEDAEPLGSDKELRNAEKMNGTDTDITRKMDGIKLGRTSVEDFPACSLEQEDTWSDMRFQVMKLMEENLHQQGELIRRNDEYRETVKELRFELERLQSENRALQSGRRSSNADVKRNQSSISKTDVKCNQSSISKVDVKHNQSNISKVDVKCNQSNISKVDVKCNQSSISKVDVKCNQSSISKLKRIVLSKLSRDGSA